MAIKNLGTFGAAVSAFLLLGHSVSSSIPFVAPIAWKLIAFLVSIAIAVAVAFIVRHETENEAVALFCGLGALASLVLIVGAIV